MYIYKKLMIFDVWDHLVSFIQHVAKKDAVALSSNSQFAHVFGSCSSMRGRKWRLKAVEGMQLQAADDVDIFM